MKMYAELAAWWPLLSAPADYAEEADAFIDILNLPPGERPTLLELGAGGGNLASHLKARFAITLSDRSPEMVEVSRALNPDLDHVVGDMRTLRLDRIFDVVLIHDAVMYCTTPDDLRAALETAAAHCRPGGTVVVAPDCVKETFEPRTETGGEDGPDGRGLRYLEWSCDPDPSDTTIEVLYALLLREPGGAVRVELDRHVEGVFTERDWLATLADVGLAVRVVRDRWGRHVFVGVRTKADHG